MDSVNEDKLYELYYSGSINTIQINCVYINANRSIVKSEKSLYLLKNENMITKDEIINIIKRQRSNHTIFSILKYNFDLDPTDIVSFLEKEEIPSNIYLTSLKKIEDVKFNNTILFFQELNELIILFYENKSYSNRTKRVYITHPHKKTHKRPVDDVNKVI